MKILFLTDNFPPEVNAPATRTYEHAVEWVRSGAEVTVITCQPNFPQGRIYEGYKNTFRKEELMEGIRVIRVWSYMSANQGFLKRTLDYLSFAVTASIVGLFEKTDVIIATSPQFFTTWAGAFLSFMKRKPWIFELRDLWPESIASVGAMSKESRVYKVLERIELFLYRNADLVIPNTPAFKKNLIKRGIDNEKITVIVNGSNLELFDSSKVTRNVREELGLEDKFVVGYIGTHGLAHSLGFIIRTIGEYTFEGVHFLFIGDGAEKQRVMELSKEMELANVSFLDAVPKERIPEYLTAIDASLAPLKKSDTFKTVIPSKIFEAAAMGKPVLLGVEGQAQEIIEEFESGICFEPENPDSFSKALVDLKSDTERYDRIKMNAFNMAKQYDRKKLATEMLTYIEEVAGTDFKH